MAEGRWGLAGQCCTDMKPDQYYFEALSGPEEQTFTGKGVTVMKWTHLVASFEHKSSYKI